MMGRRNHGKMDPLESSNFAGKAILANLALQSFGQNLNEMKKSPLLRKFRL